MCNISLLKQELSDDPLNKGYGAMNESEVCDSMNAVNRTRLKKSVTGSALIKAIWSAYRALAAEDREMLTMLMSEGSFDPSDADTMDIINTLFPGATQQAKIAVLINETVSRQVELGIGEFYEGDVMEARG